MTLDERRVRQQWKAALAATNECLSLEELSRLSSHLSSCARCQTELAMLQEFEQATPRPDEAAEVSFITAELKRRSGGRMGGLVTRKRFAARRIGTAAMVLAAMLLLIAGGLYLRSEKEPLL